MTLKNAATLAFVGTLLLAGLLVWDLVFDIVNVAQGLIPPAKLFPSLIYSFAGISLALFFYVFQKTQR